MVSFKDKTKTVYLETEDEVIDVVGSAFYCRDCRIISDRNASDRARIGFGWDSDLRISDRIGSVCFIDLGSNRIRI